MNYISAPWMTPIVGLLTHFFIGYVMEKKLTKEEFLKGIQMSFLFHLWFFMLRYIAPLALIVIILEQAEILNLSYLLNLIKQRSYHLSEIMFRIRFDF
ncbi:MAG: hypothetical protein P0S93_04245 [Candidatus Neptunochlamydia sp.]|nr:hypothetical protein [Candidatus Neptunochlamydia sp.]